MNIITSFMKRHPLVAYFILAYALACLSQLWRVAVDPDGFMLIVRSVSPESRAPVPS